MTTPSPRTGESQMTTPEQVPPRPQKRRVKIDPAGDPGGELEQLLIRNKQLADKADEAGGEAQDAKDSVKAYLKKLLQAVPGPPPEAVDVAADPHGRYPGYTMTLKGGK